MIAALTMYLYSLPSAYSPFLVNRINDEHAKQALGALINKNGFCAFIFIFAYTHCYLRVSLH